MEDFFELDPLRRIERVSPPPDLLDRVKADIHAQSYIRLSTKWVLAAGLAFMVLCSVNLLLIRAWLHQQEHDPLTSMVDQLHLAPQNQLYHE